MKIEERLNKIVYLLKVSAARLKFEFHFCNPPKRRKEQVFGLTSDLLMCTVPLTVTPTCAYLYAL